MIKGNQQKNSQSSLMGWLLCLPIRILGWLLLCCFITQLLVIIFITFLGHQVVPTYLDQLLSVEATYYADHIANLSWLGFLVNPAMHGVQSLRQVAQHLTNINSMKTSSKNGSIGVLIKIFYPSLAVYIKAAMAALELNVLRVSTLLAYLPLHLLLAIIGFNNGLVQRYLRRINGGRETALVYHFGKFAVKSFIFWGYFVYMILPLPLEPSLILLPCILGSAIAVYTATRTFKKYV